MEIRKGKLNNIERKKLTEAGCFIKDYTVNGEDYTYIIHPVMPKGD